VTACGNPALTPKFFWGQAVTGEEN
jgi:predicted transcriptional regulator